MILHQTHEKKSSHCFSTASTPKTHKPWRGMLPAQQPRRLLMLQKLMEDPAGQFCTNSPTTKPCFSCWKMQDLPWQGFSLDGIDAALRPVFTFQHRCAADRSISTDAAQMWTDSQINSSFHLASVHFWIMLACWRLLCMNMTLNLHLFVSKHVSESLHWSPYEIIRFNSFQFNFIYI